MSSLCRVHFVSNCPICNPTESSAYQESQPIPQVAPVEVTPKSSAISEPLLVLSGQANLVKSAAEIYALACDAVEVYSRKLTDLQQAVRDTKQLLKDATKKRRRLGIELIANIKSKKSDESESDKSSEQSKIGS